MNERLPHQEGPSRPELENLSLLIFRLTWGEAPLLKDFPTKLYIPPEISERCIQLVQIALTHTLDIAEVRKRAERAISKNPLEWIRRFVWKDYDAVQKEWALNIEATLGLTIDALEQGKRTINPEVSSSFVVNQTGRITSTIPHTGTPSSSLTEIPLTPSRERLGLDVHTHPIDHPPSLPDDLYPLLLAAAKDLLFPTSSGIMAITEIDSWLVLRSRETPLFSLSKTERDNRFQNWITLGDAENRQRRLFEFASEHRLAVYRGSRFHLDTVQLVK